MHEMCVCLTGREGPSVLQVLVAGGRRREVLGQVGDRWRFLWMMDVTDSL